MAGHDKDQVIELSREELYHLVWTTPATKLAKKFEISDVALSKVCKKHEIPKPALGYWARISAGQRVKKPPLPLPTEERGTIVFNVGANRVRRAEWVLPTLHQSEKSMAQTILLPTPEAKLHPIAEQVKTLLGKGVPDETGRTHIQVKDLPEILVSPSQAGRVAGVVHVLIEKALELGFELKEAEPIIHFAHKQDYLTLRIEEQIEEVEHPVTKEQKRKPSWTWNNKSKHLTGRFSFHLSMTYEYSKRSWTRNSSSRPLEEILAAVAERMGIAFEKFKQNQIIAEEREKRWAEERKRQEEENAKKKHLQALYDIREKRASNFANAAEWWRIFNDMQRFIETCEAKWKDEGAESLTTEQELWLQWARAHAERTSPFAANYPDPKIDGPLDDASIPFGGPYPGVNSIPDPPILQKRESTSSPSWGYSGNQSVKPYPFWLKYPKH